MRFVQTQRRLASHTAWRSQFCCSTGLGRILGSLCSPPAHRFALPSRHQAVLDNLSLAQKQPAQPRVHPKPYRRDTRERKTAARMQPRMERRNEVTAPPASPRQMRPPHTPTPHPCRDPSPSTLAPHPAFSGSCPPFPLPCGAPRVTWPPIWPQAAAGQGLIAPPPQLCSASPRPARQPPAPRRLPPPAAGPRSQELSFLFT